MDFSSPLQASAPPPLLDLRCFAPWSSVQGARNIRVLASPKDLFYYPTHLCLSPLWGTLQSHPTQNEQELSFLSHLLSPSQSSMLKEDTWSSPMILLSFTRTSKPAAGLRNLSRTHTLLSSSEPTPRRPTSSTASLTSGASLPQLLWSFSMVSYNPPHILMSFHFFWIPSLMSWPRSILTVSSPPSQPHFTQVTPGSLCFNHTYLHLHTQ